MENTTSTIAVNLAESCVRLCLAPFLLLIRFAGNSTIKQMRFQFYSEFISLLPFRIGMLARRVFYQGTLQRCGVNPVLRMGTIFIYPQAELGNNVFMGNRCVIGLASIGDDVMLAHGVSVLSGRHHHQRGEDGPMRAQKSTVTQIHIGNDVWIGAGAIVMADVGDHAIIGAGAVVVKPVPCGATVVGNPARIVQQTSA